MPQGLDSCGGNHQDNWEGSGDPWVSIGSDGTSYFSSLVWAHFATPPLSAYRSIAHTVTSFDGGKTWTPPALVGKFNATSDKDMILADRSRPGVVYDVWRNASFGLPVPAENGKSELLFSRSTDYGRTWARQTVVATVPYSTIYGDPQLAELANGTLVYTTGLASAHGAPQFLAFRSTTEGKRWSGPALIRENPPANPNETICGNSFDYAGLSSPPGQNAVLRGRTVLQVSIDAAAAKAGIGKLVLSRSDDGGKTWHSRVIATTRSPIALTSVATNSHGQIGVIWDEYDAAAANCSANIVPARTEFTVSSDGGDHWSQTTVGAGSWNLGSELLPDGAGGLQYYIGDYQALAGTGDGFTTIAVQGQPLVHDSHSPQLTGKTGVIVPRSTPSGRTRSTQTASRQPKRIPPGSWPFAGRCTASAAARCGPSPTRAACAGAPPRGCS